MNYADYRESIKAELSAYEKDPGQFDTDFADYKKLDELHNNLYPLPDYLTELTPTQRTPDWFIGKAATDVGGTTIGKLIEVLMPVGNEATNDVKRITGRNRRLKNYITEYIKQLENPFPKNIMDVEIAAVSGSILEEKLSQLTSDFMNGDYRKQIERITKNEPVFLKTMGLVSLKENDYNIDRLMKILACVNIDEKDARQMSIDFIKAVCVSVDNVVVDSTNNMIGVIEFKTDRDSTKTDLNFSNYQLLKKQLKPKFIIQMLLYSLILNVDYAWLVVLNIASNRRANSTNDFKLYLYPYNVLAGDIMNIIQVMIITMVVYIHRFKTGVMDEEDFIEKILEIPVESIYQKLNDCSTEDIQELQGNDNISDEIMEFLESKKSEIVFHIGRKRRFYIRQSGNVIL